MHRAARLFAHGVNQDAVLPDATPHFAGRVIILRAPRCHSTLPPVSPSVCPDYRKLSTIIPPPHPYTSVQTLRHFIPFHSVRVSRDRLRRRSIYVTGNETRYRWSRERMLLEKEFEPARVKRILFVFSFSSYTPWDC